MENKQGLSTITIVIIVALIFIIVLGIYFSYFYTRETKKIDDLENLASISLFYSNLQDDINKAWQSSETESQFRINLPSYISEVCLVDYSSKFSSLIYLNQIKDYERLGANIVLLSNEEIDMPYNALEHIDISKITENSNPYCKDASGELTIKKEFTDSLVTLK